MPRSRLSPVTYRRKLHVTKCLMRDETNVETAMPRDFDERRGLSNAWLDRRQDRLDLMRAQQQRTHAVHDSLRRGDSAAAMRALGIAAGMHASRDPAEDACAAAAADVSRRRHAVFARIDEQRDIDEAVRRAWHDRFDAIELLLHQGRDAVERFEGSIIAQTQTLHDLARRLRATLESVQARATPLPLRRFAPGTPSAADLLDRFFPQGLGGIVQQIERSALLFTTAKQRWTTPLQALDAQQNAPRPALPDVDRFTALRRLSDPDGCARHAGHTATETASRVADEIDEAAGCSSLHTALLLLRADCALYRAALRRSVM